MKVLPFVTLFSSTIVLGLVSLTPISSSVTSQYYGDANIGIANINLAFNSPSMDIITPLCDCPNPTTQVWIKEYRGSRNTSCDTTFPGNPYRLGRANHEKTICNNGGYWTCTYYEDNYLCTNTAQTQPSCPENTCNPEID